MRNRRSRISVLAVTALALLGCDVSVPWSPGGSGDEPGDGTPIAPSSLGFKGWLHGPAPAGQLVKVSGLPDGAWVWVEKVPPVVAASSCAPPPAGTKAVCLTMAPPDEVGQGTFAGTVTVHAQWLQTRAELPGSPWTIPYTYQVGPPALTGLPPSMELRALIGQWPPEPIPALELAGAPGAGPWSLRILQGANPWLSAVGPTQGASLPASVALEVITPPSQTTVDDTATIEVSRAGQVALVRVVRHARRPEIQVEVAPIALAITANQAEHPAFTVRVDTEAGVTAEGIVQVTYDPGWSQDVPSWLDYSWQMYAPVEVPFQVSTTALAAGRYTAEISITGQYTQTKFVVPVTLDVAPTPAALAPASLLFRLDAAATTASLQAELALASTGSPLTWSATTDAAWLRVTQAGNTPAGGSSTLSVEVVPEALDVLRCGTGTARVEVQASADGLPTLAFSVPVELRLELPCMLALGPASDVAGGLEEVVIVGDYLTAGARVLFGDVAAPSVRAPHGTELRVTPPALPAGTYQVTIPTALGFPVGTATYRLVAPRSPAAASLEAPGRKARLVFDDDAGLLWAVNAGGGMLEHYAEASGWRRGAIDLPALADAAPIPGASRWLALTSGLLQTVDTAGLPNVAIEPLSALGQDYTSMALTLDGRALLVGTQVNGPWTSHVSATYNLATHRLEEVGSGSYGIVLRSSRSGLRAAGGFGGYLELWWAAYRAYGYAPTDLGDWASHRYIDFTVDEMALGRHGDAILAIRQEGVGPGSSVLLDEGLNARPGRLPASTTAAVLTQSGDRAIAFDGALRTVRIFDLASAPDLATGEFVELGSAGGLAPLDDPGAAVVMALSADDRTLFLGGDDRIVVVPLP